ncbi:hypothetical protein GIB67_040471 [Kingdonia uniflora]|uniref:Pentatricopeptide repeat-containing protein n=1 Tax=Kingdonia uniflora TaxID=39325 RepID=A0A7J7L586_9MAGN|nr:hypothetical protein GIB67_040471 [Kingdonia uniflora]
MQTAIVMFRQRSSIKTILRILPISSSSPLFLNLISYPSRFCTKVGLKESKLDDPSSLSWRVEKLLRGESVVSAFQSWMGEGLPIQRGDISQAINRLRMLRLNKRALEVMEWVIRERPYKPKELDYSYLLEFTIKLHGVPHGESLFSRIPDEFQNDLLYNNLVIACLNQGKIRISLAYMKQMRVLGYPISHLVFNRLIVLHSTHKRKKNIPKILTQMKADGVAPHVSTYNILLKIEANQHNIERLGTVFDQMKRAKVEPNEITYCILATAHAVARLNVVAETYADALEKFKTEKNWATLDALLILYGHLGKEVELERTWEAVQNLPYLSYKSIMLAIEAFGRLGRVERAEDLWSEMRSRQHSKSTEEFNSIMSVYCKHGLIDKATELLKEMKANGCTPNAPTYLHLTLGCLKGGLIEKAMKTFEAGTDQTIARSVKRSISWLETTLSIVQVFADMGDVENAKKFFGDLKEARYSKYTFVCNSLIKAFVKARVYEPDLLKSMILGGARPDAETYCLVKLVEEFRT